MNLLKNMYVNLLIRQFLVVIVISYALADVSELVGSGANQQYTLEQAIRGTPNSDYPIYSKPPQTSFSCAKKDFGYYVDIEARCQVFRVCANTDTSGMGFTFLCPNGTLFNQQYMVCDWYYNVNCQDSEKYFGMNKVLGKTPGPMTKIMQEVKEMMMFPFKDRNGKSTFQPEINPYQPPFFGGPGSIDIRNPGSGSRNVPGTNGFNPEIPSFTGNGPTQGFVSGVPSRSGTLPPSRGGNGPVYVSNLGELSTDPNSSFNPQKSNVIRVSSDSEDPTKAEAGTQVFTYPNNGDGRGGSRTGRKRGNGYERVTPKVGLNPNSFAEGFGVTDKTVNIGGGKATRKPTLPNRNTGNRKKPSPDDKDEEVDEYDIDDSSEEKPSSVRKPARKPTKITSDEDVDDYEEPSSRPALPKPKGTKKVGNRKTSTDTTSVDSEEEIEDYENKESNEDGDEDVENGDEETFNVNNSKKTKTTKSRQTQRRQQTKKTKTNSNVRQSNGQQNNGKQNQNQQYQNQQQQQYQQNFKSSSNNDLRQSTHDEIFSIVQSVLNERHGGFDSFQGAQRRSDNFGSTPQYQIVPSIDLSNSASQFLNIPGLNLPGGNTGSTRTNYQQNYHRQHNGQSNFGQNHHGQHNGQSNFGQNRGNGFEISQARLVSQNSGSFSSSSNQQFVNLQRPGQRRSGPNVEIIPVPLRRVSEESDSNSHQGASSNDQPFAIPQNVKDIKASNFLLNYNPVLSKPAENPVFVQIIKAEDTYVNDGSGRARPLTGANQSNTKQLPSNFAQVQPGIEQTAPVTPFEITGGRPSSYDVPLNSVGPLDQTRTTNDKLSDSFKGYHY